MNKILIIGFIMSFIIFSGCEDGNMSEKQQMEQMQWLRDHELVVIELPPEDPPEDPPRRPTFENSLINP